MSMIRELPIERRAANRLPPPPRADVLGMRVAIDAVLQRWRLALGTFVAVMALAVAYLVLGEPVYRADTIVEVEAKPRTSLLPSLAGGERSVLDGDIARATGEIEILRSRDVLMPAILASGADIELGMPRWWGVVPLGARSGVDVPWFSVPSARRGKAFSLVVRDGRWTLDDKEGERVAAGPVGQATSFKLDGQTAWIVVKAPTDTGPIHLSVTAKTEQRALLDVIDSMRVFEPSRDSNIVRLAFEDTRPARAAMLLNRQVANYLVLTHERRHAAAARALAEFESQLPALQTRMVEAEDALRDFQARTTAAPFVNEVDALLRQRADLERQRVDLGIKRDQLAQTLTPAHPDLAAAQAQLARVDREIARIEQQASRFPVQQQGSVRLQREVQVATALYTTMLNHVQQLRLNTGSIFSGARQLDVAVEPVEKLRPRAAATLAIGAGLGLLAALAAVVLARALQPTVDHAIEFDTPASAPATLAFLPESAAQRELQNDRLSGEAADAERGAHRILVRAAPHDPASESLRAAHAAMLIRARAHPLHVLMVTSPSRGAGKTFVAANLATLMADAGHRVLLVEADLRQPTLHEYLRIDPSAPGLGDVMSGQQAVEDVIRRHATLGLDVLTAGTPAAHPGSALHTAGFEAMFEDLRTRYDRIVINAAPMLPAGDAVAAGRVCDQALLVVRAEESLVHETQVAQRRLAQAAIRLESIVVNGVKRNRLSAPRHA